MEKSAKIFVAGHRGMVGSALVRKLQVEGFNNLVLKSSSELDLRNQAIVENFFSTEKLDYVFLAAAKVGGILANSIYRADFLYENLMIESNVIHQSYVNQVKKLLFLGSSCIYPKLATQPLKEEYLLAGYLEQTNEPYAIAKIAGIKLCENYRRQYGCDFISVMPSNLYGPDDNYDLSNSHVLPALIRKFHKAKTNNESFVEVWGTGKPLREFLHVDDLANGCFFLMQNYSDGTMVNVGTGKDLMIKDLVSLVAQVSGYTGEIRWNTEKPDGTPKKLLDVSKINKLGWKYEIELEVGIASVYQEYSEVISKSFN